MADKFQQPTEIIPELLALPGNNSTGHATGPDPFDPESLRLTEDTGISLGVHRILLEVPVRKPSKEWFVRTHPDEDYHLQTAVIELKETRETYLVDRLLWPQLAGETTFAPRGLYTAINRQGDIFLWPIRLPGVDGKVDGWSRSALGAADIARSKWVRVQANMRMGAYEVLYSEHIDEPIWPDLPFSELLRIAFQDRFINTIDHPILRQLSGRI